jgi:hypothetical protein
MITVPKTLLSVLKITRDNLRASEINFKKHGQLE